MLISCPKCHSIYEIPDDLIKRTGQNFRCQACANVWHAMREDAIGYEAPTREEPYIEAIPVSEPPHRHYPANKPAFNVPADSKSGRKTPSSKELLGKTDTASTEATKTNKKEITLTSDKGTSFTISAAPLEESKPPLYFNDTKDITLTANKEARLQLETPFKGYKKTYALLTLLIIASFVGFFRREITTFFPAAEPYYNKVLLTGYNNPEYLSFKNINVSEIIVENKPMLKIDATIYNNSHYTTNVPNLTLSGVNGVFQPKAPLLKGHEETTVEIFLPKKENMSPTNLILSFKKP